MMSCSSLASLRDATAMMRKLERILEGDKVAVATKEKTKEKTKGRWRNGSAYVRRGARFDIGREGDLERPPTHQPHLGCSHCTLTRANT